MREPTAKEIAKFKRACKALDELGREGFYLYLANDNGCEQQDDVRASVTICGAGGGDW